jgi:hypothetical protein
MGHPSERRPAQRDAAWAQEVDMQPTDIDPSLCTGEPTLESLEDGFSPPAPAHSDTEAAQAGPAVPADPRLGPKSAF